MKKNKPDSLVWEGKLCNKIAQAKEDFYDRNPLEDFISARKKKLHYQLMKL